MIYWIIETWKIKSRIPKSHWFGEISPISGKIEKYIPLPLEFLALFPLLPLPGSWVRMSNHQVICRSAPSSDLSDSIHVPPVCIIIRLWDVKGVRDCNGSLGEMCAVVFYFSVASWFLYVVWLLYVDKLVLQRYYFARCQNTIVLSFDH